MNLRLGEILLENGTISHAQLDAALAQHRAHRRRLGETLVELSYCGTDQVVAALAEQAGHPSINLDVEPLDPSLAARLPRDAAVRYRAVPLREDRRQETLAIAIAAPAWPAALEALRRVTFVQRIQPFVASDQAISRAIGRLYGDPDQKPTIHLYGWQDYASRQLIPALEERQVIARPIGAIQAMEAGPTSILLAPVSAMEMLLEGGKCRSLLIAVGSKPADFPRAEALDACSFLVAPLDMDCLVRAIQRCQQLLDGHRKAAGTA